jgi:hypothetical protein
MASEILEKEENMAEVVKLRTEILTLKGKHNAIARHYRRYRERERERGSGRWHGSTSGFHLGSTSESGSTSVVSECQ